MEKRRHNVTDAPLPHGLKAATASSRLLPQKEADNNSGFSPCLRVHGVEAVPLLQTLVFATKKKQKISSVNYARGLHPPSPCKE